MQRRVLVPSLLSSFPSSLEFVRCQMEEGFKLGPEYVAKWMRLNPEQSEAAASFSGEDLRVFLDVSIPSVSNELEITVRGLRDEFAALKFDLTHKTILLRILSIESYTGFSKEAEVQAGLQPEDLFETASPEYVQTLWNEAKAIRELLEGYKRMEFSDSDKRKLWLQQSIFMPLLRLLAEKSHQHHHYRLHGNNEKLMHAHNAFALYPFSFPDAMLTRSYQFQLTAATGGPAFELEHTIERKKAKAYDKQDQCYHNGRGQVIKCLSVEALADSKRPLFVGVLTDCASIRFYKMENDPTIQFHESKQLELLSIDDKPSQGFTLLASLFNTPANRFSLPNVGPQMCALVPEFKDFPATLVLPETDGATNKENANNVTITLQGLLGFGASSIVLIGKFNDISDVCIKIGCSRKTNDNKNDDDMMSPRLPARARQITQEIRVLDALKSIPGVPKMLWARDTNKNDELIKSILVTTHVGKPLHTLVLTKEELERVYLEVKSSLEAVHKRGFCHHDISPQNIIICVEEEEEEEKENEKQKEQSEKEQAKKSKKCLKRPILIDWGLATPLNEMSLGFCGQEDFSSLAYQTRPLGYEYGAEDDLEALIYTICFVHHGLPWMKKRHPAARLAKKTACTAAEICGDLTFLLHDLEELRG